MTNSKALQELRIIIVMLLVVTSMRSALADWNDVPSGSMKPTIEVGDRVVVNKLAYDLKIPFTTIEVAKWGDPKRGDIVVLFSRDNVRLVKRVVAIPGDRLEMRENELFVNGEPATWKPVGKRFDPEQGPSIVAEEQLPGREHKVMFTPDMPATRSFAPTVVPAGKYFVMGDNRDNSNDSRFIGMIDRQKIVGKATAVAFSFDRTNHYKPRFDRFFKTIR